MTVQEVVAALLVAAAALFLGWRWLVRRRAGTCCGETECPATKQTLHRVAHDD